MSKESSSQFSSEEPDPVQASTAGPVSSVQFIRVEENKSAIDNSNKHSYTNPPGGIPISVILNGGLFDPIHPEQFKQTHKSPNAKQTSFKQKLIPPRNFINEGDRKFSSKLKEADENYAIEGTYD